MTMELADASEVGKFGTIRLLKQREPTGVVAAYPIDDDEVSFGRDPNCSVRLYYPEVSPLHCKIIFEERKAILQVFGSNGVLVDGCTVYPAKPAPIGFAPTTVSVPLPNNSVFEIHKKRFVFNYPPKALRLQLFTPAAPHRKSVRMSLVQSAQVFSPAPSPYPRENLRVLQSPLKLGSDDPVTLVSGDKPRVFEEEQDLIILEDTEEKANHPPSPTPVRTQAAPRTPRRAAPSLHRAVLIRSAQRNAYMREEFERQRTFTQPQFMQINLDEEDGEAEEEDEVMNSILDIAEEAEVAERHSLDDTIDMESDPSFDHNSQMLDGETSMDVDVDGNTQHGSQDQMSTPVRTGPIRPLGTFMTPQPYSHVQRPLRETMERRRTGPQRPPPGYIFSHDFLASPDATVKEEEAHTLEEDQTDPYAAPAKQRVTEEERKAILQRRKSALSLPDPVIGGAFLSKNNDVSGPAALPTVIRPEPPASPFKALSADIEDGEDTNVALRRLESQVARRRASLSPTRPRIAKESDSNSNPLPSLQQTFSLLAPASRPFPVAEMVKHEEEPLDFAGQADNAIVRRSSHEPALNETPRFDGIRTMFSIPQKPSGIESPAIRGVRTLFRDPSADPRTPRMDGIRHMFAEPRIPATPTFDGIENMMQVEENSSDQDVSDERSSGTTKLPKDAEEGESGASGSNQNDIARPKRVQSKVPRRLPTKTKGTPSDMSTMADDEATPDALTFAQRTRSDAGLPEGAVVHRTGRARRVPINSSAGNESEKKVPPSPKRGRQIRLKVEESTQPLSKPASKDGAPPRTRTRTADASALDSEARAIDNDAEKKPGRATKGRVARAAQAETTSDTTAAPTRRTTRARSRSIDPEAEADAEQPLQKAQKKSDPPRSVDTIPEKEEPESPKERGQGKRPVTTTRARRMRAETASSVEDGTSAMSKRRTPVSSLRKSTRAAGKSGATDNGEDKENTPEHSPISESGEASTGSKVKGKTPASTGTTRKTTASKALKASDDSVVVPRATRARSRK